MPAPTLLGSRGPLTITYNDPMTGVPVELRGFRINASINSPTPTSPWSLSVSTTIVDAAQIDAEDQSYRATKTKTLPLNEFPNLSDAEAELQSMVDEVYDEIPTPAVPPSP